MLARTAARPHGRALPLPVAGLAALLLWLAPSPARAQGGLSYQVPEGFTVVAQGGVATPEARRSPVLSQLAGQPRIKLIAARMGADGQLESTFQVMVKDRAYTFTPETIDRFATEITGELTAGGMPPTVHKKDVITVAGRPAGRVVVTSQLRRMMFIGVPDGDKTALLLYAAGERDFPTLYPSFERSLQATRRQGAEEAARKEPEAASTTPVAARVESPPERDWSALAPLGLGVLGLVAIVVLRLRRPKPEPAQSPTPPADRKRRR